MRQRRRRPAQLRVRLRTLSIAEPACEECSKALLILARTHESADALLKAYTLARRQRGGPGSRSPRGMSTDEEHDLLRAMLVMAAAGLDSMVKQLVRDALPRVVHEDAHARSGLERYLAGRLRPGDPEFLSKVLAAPAPTTAVVDAYVEQLTGSSLQSAAELARAASAFGLEPREVGIDFEQLRSIFDIRNKIIHELDINFAAQRRIRNVRRAPIMGAHTNTLLDIGERILRAVDGKLQQLAQGQR